MTADRRAKQVLVVRKDLTMRKGKIAAQCAHASLMVLLDRMPGSGIAPRTRTLSDEPGSALAAWLEGSFAKVCVYVQSAEELDRVHREALARGLPAALVVDSGRTEFHGVPTPTVAAIGPGWIDEVDAVTGDLPLL